MSPRSSRVRDSPRTMLQMVVDDLRPDGVDDLRSVVDHRHGGYLSYKSVNRNNPNIDMSNEIEALKIACRVQGQVGV
jgi:hypothetical protein